MAMLGTDPPPLPLLITGVAGVAGYNALRYFEKLYPRQVIGIRQEDNWRLRGPNIVACNAESRSDLLQLFKQYRFGAVLNCAGNCALRACELDTRLAWRTNVEGLINLLSIAVERDVRLVHTSIDLVFSGKELGANGEKGDGNHLPERPEGCFAQMVPDTFFSYCESHTTDPVTVYGKTMVAAEQLLADWMPEACVLRISLPMGISFNGHAGAIDWIQSRFQKGRPATLYFDEVRSPTYTDCLNRLYAQVLSNHLTGLYHAGGPRRLSLYEIAQIVNRVGGYDPDLLIGCPRIEAGPMPPRAGNVTMDSSKLAGAIGFVPFDPWPLDDRLVPSDRQWHYQREGERGSPELLAKELYRNPRLASMC